MKYPWLLALAACRSAPSTDQPDAAGSPDAAMPMIDAAENHDAPPFVGPGPGIIPGDPDVLILFGTVVTPDVVQEGAVVIDHGKITCVGDCTADGATQIQTDGIIAPGLIDTHNHILFDIFDNDDWKPAQVYGDHDQWPDEPKYQAMLDTKQCLVNDSQGKPAWCAMTPYGTSAGSLRCEVDKWGELKGVVAGETSIVGLPGTSAACFGSLARSIDVAQSGLESDKIQTSALYPPSDPTTACANFASGKTDAYLIHAGEGIDAKAQGEFAKLNACLLTHQVAITHGTAFTAAQFQQMADAQMKLIWSPQSNVSLYGATADIPSALATGLVIALAPDWSMGGSQNILDELRFAKQWDHDHWGDVLSSRLLVEMVTTHAASALALDGQIGTLAVGAIGDVSVFAGDRAHPYDAILAAHPSDVRLDIVGGQLLYGDALYNSTCEQLDVCGKPKFLCAAQTSTANKFNQTKADIEAALTTALQMADTLTPDDGFNFAPLAPLVHCP